MHPEQNFTISFDQDSRLERVSHELVDDSAAPLSITVVDGYQLVVAVYGSGYVVSDGIPQELVPGAPLRHAAGTQYEIYTRPGASVFVYLYDLVPKEPEHD